MTDGPLNTSVTMTYTVLGMSQYMSYVMFDMLYCISRIIGEHYNIWQFALKHCWRDFKLAVLSTVCRETHACSINGLIMASVNLAILCNRQIKITVNISAYTICHNISFGFATLIYAYN